MMMSVWITQHPPPDDITIWYYNPTGFSWLRGGSHGMCTYVYMWCHLQTWSHQLQKYLNLNLVGMNEWIRGYMWESEVQLSLIHVFLHFKLNMKQSDISVIRTSGKPHETCWLAKFIKKKKKKEVGSGRQGGERRGDRGKEGRESEKVSR